MPAYLQNTGRLSVLAATAVRRVTVSCGHASAYFWHSDARQAPLRLAVIFAAVVSTGCDEATVIAASRGASDLAPLLLWVPTLAAIVWAGVAYTALGWAERLPLVRTPRTNVAILVGGGVVLPVMVMTGLLAFLGIGLAL